MHLSFLPQHILLLCLLSHIRLAISAWPTEGPDSDVRQFFDRNAVGAASESEHTNNWAVLHMANALGMYRTVKRLGIPDSNIILMLADDVACNARNRYPGCVFANKGRHLDLYGENIEVDYRGYEVTVENFLRVLTGRVEPSVPRSKRLLTDDRSNIFVYMTGHGGNEFLKFQDNEEISAFDIADAFEQMWQKKRYNEIFFMIDTCQANTMYSKFYSPNILATGSSEIRENSYSYENDNDIGVAVIDSFTHFVLDFMEGINKTSHASMTDLFSKYDPVTIRSHAGVRADLFNRPLERTLITDFFGGVAHAEVLASSVVDTGLSIPLSQNHPLDGYSSEEQFVENVEVELWEDVSTIESDSAPWTLRAWASLFVVGGLPTFSSPSFSGEDGCKLVSCYGDLYNIMIPSTLLSFEDTVHNSK
ncbi:cysteine protease C13 [Heterobasidion irregulare TC 32-1]|uniref:Cysteine protease C13 n=1 Tax=Heterobasidion irregulare (strain TC 32-1) TaxID=747525 RepID=W4JXH5_HETIT|nr:cysteine protease C13 [Heterobasidion irregulare TC 32-1]ETW78248.1 cysteine protease C13 [Heterobasidion irregulare TC 32-1]